VHVTHEAVHASHDHVRIARFHLTVTRDTRADVFPDDLRNAHLRCVGPPRRGQRGSREQRDRQGHPQGQGSASWPARPARRGCGRSRSLVCHDVMMSARQRQRRVSRPASSNMGRPTAICIPNASARERMANRAAQLRTPVLRSVWKARLLCVTNAVVSTCRDLPQPAVGARGASASDGAGHHS